MRWPATLDAQESAILKAAKDIGAEWTLGVRAITGAFYFDVEVPSVGDVLGPSYEWNDGEPSDVQLDGTSALFLPRRRGVAYDVRRVLRLLNAYIRTGAVAVVLVAGEHAGDGVDEGEILLRDPEVMAVWTLKP